MHSTEKIAKEPKNSNLPRTPDCESVNLPAHHAQIPKKFGDSKKVRIFAATIVQTGGQFRLYAAGIFYALSLLIICGSVPPCGALMRPQPVCGDSQRERRNRFYLSNKQLYSND
jgi:hypothetical protein